MKLGMPIWMMVALALAIVVVCTAVACSSYEPPPKPPTPIPPKGYTAFKEKAVEDKAHETRHRRINRVFEGCGATGGHAMSLTGEELRREASSTQSSLFYKPSIDTLRHAQYLLYTGNRQWEATFWEYMRQCAREQIDGDGADALIERVLSRVRRDTPIRQWVESKITARPPFP